MAALQNRWDESLRERAAIAPHSPVPLLDGLLSAYRKATSFPLRVLPKLISQIPPKMTKASLSEEDEACLARP